MGVGIVFHNCFWVQSCSWTNFILYVSFNSDIWLWLNFGVIFYFLGPNGLFLALGKGSKNFWGSTHVVEQLSFCMLTNPKSESKSDLGFSPHPGKVDRVELGLPKENKSCLFRLVELHKSIGTNLEQNKPDSRSNHKWRHPECMF